MKEKSEEEKAICLECGNVIPYGSRKDKIFCSEHCKNRYYYRNKPKMRSRNAHLKVLNALDRNYQILDELVRAKVMHASINDLVLKGYNTSYITAFRNGSPRREFWCFDIRFCMSESRIYKISRSEDITPG